MEDPLFVNPVTYMTISTKTRLVCTSMRIEIIKLKNIL